MQYVPEGLKHLEAELLEEAEQPCGNLGHSFAVKRLRELETVFQDLQEERGYGPDYRATRAKLQEAHAKLVSYLWIRSESVTGVSQSHHVALQYQNWVQGLQLLQEVVEAMMER